MENIIADKPLEKEILPLFTSAIPFQLPSEWKEFIVKVSPYIMLILVPLTIFAIGITAILSVFSTLLLHPIWALATVATLLGLVCSLLSIKGLFDRKREGWVWSYYAFLLFLISDLLHFHFIDAIFTFLISGYFLFQIREYYK
ncbi:hypothetical protein GCM10011514_41480 [Emticicia aquatilis]|uniref:Uncharacterized protein n=1 Tax=Emticicia aquatilis TaxID=1537369 RepID=A0A916Z245_9BACT|nr:hypothetical protein [Emticicia aquatilis]GGD73087.1 hypothetical protein GCM10011514_41480 [Emticicia aquatilis]